MTNEEIYAARYSKPINFKFVAGTAAVLITVGLAIHFGGELAIGAIAGATVLTIVNLIRKS